MVNRSRQFPATQTADVQPWLQSVPSSAGWQVLSDPQLSHVAQVFPHSRTSPHSVMTLPHLP